MKTAIIVPQYDTEDSFDVQRPLPNIFEIPDDKEARDKMLTELFWETFEEDEYKERLDNGTVKIQLACGNDSWGDVAVECNGLYLFVTYTLGNGII
jgi:hypothetical protein